MVRLRRVPFRSREAAAFVTMWHRHHRAPRGQIFAVGAADQKGVLRAVAICGRPVTRHLDYGTTLEVTRLDRGKKGSKLHVLSEARASPGRRSIGREHPPHPGSETARAIPAARSRRGPRRHRPIKLRADKAHFSAENLPGSAKEDSSAHRPPGHRIERTARPSPAHTRLLLDSTLIECTHRRWLTIA